MRRRLGRDSETTYWLSYSDMMAGLLLVFVIIIAVSMLHAKIQYDEKELELSGKEEELLIRSDELEKEREVVSKEKIAIQEKTLKEQHELLNKLEAIMSEQQQKLDDIIGVRAELVEELREEFDDSDLKVSVDETTGAITFDASILFDYNKSVLKESGKDFLSKFLPRYADVLLSDKYKDNISEILIEGHTDTEGKYLFNLELSQKRALAVASYCLDDNSGVVDDEQLEALRELTSATGKSYSNPVLDEEGEVDMEASRRVEFLFRLKDEEMVREMIEILSDEEE